MISEDPNEKKAKRLEREALHKRQSFSSGEEIGKKYEEAGDNWTESGNFIKAEDNYRNANIYGYAHDTKNEKRVQAKIDSLRLKKKLTLAFPSIKKSTIEKMVEDEENRIKFLPAVISIASLLFALFFISSNLTGFSVFNLTYNNSRWIGSCFFICGLIFTFIYLKIKTKKK
jgi:hypothetical protein